MSISGRWFMPGPVEVHPEVLAAMSRPVFHHRSVMARELLERLQPALRGLFRTTSPVLMQTATATALMEAAIRCGVRDRVLCIISGTFGERFADIAERCDKEVVRLRVARGEVLEASQLARFLDGPPVDAITLVHAESSTGTLAPIAELRPLLQRFPDAVVIMDVVASLGATAVETDAWGIDFTLAASQKALALPPGLAFGVASPRFLERAEQQDDRGRYLDIVDLHRAAAENRFPQTPAIPLIHALDAQLQRITTEGLSRRESRHQAMRSIVERWVEQDERLLFMAPVGRRSDAVSALRLPEPMAAPEVVECLRVQNWNIGTGIDADRNDVIRIGHMGEVQPAQLEELLEGVGQVLDGLHR